MRELGSFDIESARYGISVKIRKTYDPSIQYLTCLCDTVLLQQLWWLLTHQLRSDVAVVFIDIEHILHVCLHVLYVTPEMIEANFTTERPN